jgi:hypothetical protein
MTDPIDFYSDAPLTDEQIARTVKPEALVREWRKSESEVKELRGQCVRWEAMYEGMKAERDGYWLDLDEMVELKNYWQDETMNLRAAGIWCADCPLPRKRS